MKKVSILFLKFLFAVILLYLLGAFINYFGMVVYAFSILLISAPIILHNASRFSLKKEIKLIDSKISNISSQIDNIYFDKINHVISQDDYFRYTNKIINERDSLINQKNEINKIINDIKEKQGKHSEKEMNEIINEFLSNPSKKSIYRLIDNIEIDENKNIYIHFAFNKLNIVNEINKNCL